jgi:hypothetical protein
MVDRSVDRTSWGRDRKRSSHSQWHLGFRYTHNRRFSRLDAQPGHRDDDRARSVADRGGTKAQLPNGGGDARATADEEVRSISKAGLSVVTVTFDDDVDLYFARAQSSAINVLVEAVS